MSASAEVEHGGERQVASMQAPVARASKAPRRCVSHTLRVTDAAHTVPEYAAGWARFSADPAPLSDPGRAHPILLQTSCPKRTPLPSSASASVCCLPAATAFSLMPRNDSINLGRGCSVGLPSWPRRFKTPAEWYPHAHSSPVSATA